MEPQNKVPLKHYYGDIVRFIFIVAGVVVLLSFPIITKSLGVPVIFLVLWLIILGVAAGITNPEQKSSLVLNICVSIIGFISFFSLSAKMQQLSMNTFFFVLNQLVTASFMLAIYFSIKSLRGFLLSK